MEIADTRANQQLDAEWDINKHHDDVDGPVSRRTCQGYVKEGYVKITNLQMNSPTANGFSLAFKFVMWTRVNIFNLCLNHKQLQMLRQGSLKECNFPWLIETYLLQFQILWHIRTDDS